MNNSENWIQHDGIDFYTRTWKSTLQPPKAVVTALHGHGEHIDRYDEMFQKWSQQGIQVFGYDQRGFGKTAQKRNGFGDSQGVNKTMEDIKKMIELSRIQGVSHFLFGHSMGGLHALCFASLYGEECHLAGVISQGPFLRPPPNGSHGPIFMMLGKLAAKILPKLKISAGIDVDHLSRDADVIKQYKKDHLNVDSGTLQYFNDCLEKGELMINSYCKKLRIPLLFAQGADDRICLLKDAKEFYSNLPNDIDKTMRIYPGCYHEVHLDLDRNQAIQDYLDWILSKCQN